MTTERKVTDRTDIPKDVLVFLDDCLNPERFGYAVTPEVRDRVRELLGIPKCETKPKNLAEELKEHWRRMNGTT